MVKKNSTKTKVQPYEIGELDHYLFGQGNHYEIYKKMGAHEVTKNGKRGVYFAVWAPHAVNVSVIGEFNDWDETKDKMKRGEPLGIYTCFVPEAKKGDLYKFCIETQAGEKIYKADPFANYAELRPGTASRITDISNLNWSDSKWMTAREKWDNKEEPVSIYEVHMGSWMRHPGREDEGFYTYREFAEAITKYVKEMGYTHVELMPVMEHPFDGSWGYQVTGYYAPTSRYGTSEDFMYFVDYLHKQGIGVILDWVPAHFPKDNFGLSNFDGTCLYEHADPRQGVHPHWGTLIFNYGRPQVSNFLIANAMFWADKYHVDGIRMDAVASMLYLDYGKNDGEWIPNIYGGNENLEAIEFLKHLNSMFKKKYPDALLIAEESTAWPKITGELNDEGLGFDYKWNMGWMNDFIDYMKKDPLFRGGAHDELTFSMVYAYSEKFMLCLSHDEVVHGKASLLMKMPGTMEEKFANLRAAYGFMTVHPGKKLLFMGQEFAQEREWSEERGLDWELLETPEHAQFQEYVKALWKFYREAPALYELDDDPDGFEWINHMESEKNMLTLIRKSKKKEETLVIVCNFSALKYEKYQMGVPYAGKYKEVFNSDGKQFGGTGAGNPRLKSSKKTEADERKNSLTITVAPLAIQIFAFKEAEEEKKAPKKTVRKALEKKIEKEREKELKQQEIKLPKEEVKSMPEKSKVKPEPKKLEVKPEPQKLEAKPEPEKLEAKPEPQKLEAKPEPKKLERKQKKRGRTGRKK